MEGVMMFTEAEEQYFTLCELEYIDTDNLTKEETNIIDKAINILTRNLKNENYDLTDEEIETLSEAVQLEHSEFENVTAD